MPNNANGTITRLDVVVSNDSFSSLCSGAAEVVTKVKNWKHDLISFELFKDGITNHLLKCYLKDNPDNAVLIRVYGEKTELFIDRDLEVRNMQMMCDAGLCAPLYCAFANGLCYGFSPGEVLDTKMVRDPVISRLIARRLAKMHSIRTASVNGIVPQPSLFPVLHKYLQLIPESFPDPIKDEKLKSCIPSKDVLEMEIQTLKEHLVLLNSPVVFSHNDLLLKNVIYNEEKEEVTFIDYEYADYNYQALDIGNHFCEFAGVDKYEPNLYPDKEFQLKWLKEYLEAWYLENGNNSDVTEEAVEILYIQVNKFSLAAHLFWGTWALIQAAHSTLDFDFLGYAKERIDEYFSRKHFLSLCLSPNGKEANDH